MSFTNDFSDANRDFSLFRNELLSHIKGDLIDIETKDSELAKLFDQYSGIDAVQVVNRQLRAVAIRVQWGTKHGTHLRSDLNERAAQKLSTRRGLKRF